MENKDFPIFNNNHVFFYNMQIVEMHQKQNN